MDSTHMSVLGRSGTLALCAAVVLTGVLRAPKTEPTFTAPVENGAHSGGGGAPETEILVSVGRVSVSWPDDTGALYWRSRKIADDLCLCASVLTAVDYTTCRSTIEHHVRLVARHA